jgi:bacterioferritin
MAEADQSAGLGINHEQLLELLNEDLAREFQTMIEINKHIDLLNGQSEAKSNPTKASIAPITILHAVLENERKMKEHYRERLRQSDAMGEFELSETLRAIIAQQLEIKSRDPGRQHVESR